MSEQSIEALTTSVDAPGAPAVEAAAPAPQPANDGHTRDLRRAKIETALAYAGIDPDFADSVKSRAERLLEKKGLEPTKPNLDRFFEKLSGKRPELFERAASAPTRANTAPVSSSVAAPAPAALETPYSRWRALRAAGRNDEAKVYYVLNARAINRGLA